MRKIKLSIVHDFEFSEEEIELLKFLKDSPNAERMEDLSAGEEKLFEDFGDKLLEKQILTEEYDVTEFGLKVIEALDARGIL